MQDFPFLKHRGPIAMAHRGGMAESAANSMAAFARAVRLGYRYIELDVRATAEGALYVWHGPPDSARDESALDLQRLSRQERAGIVLLADVLEAFPTVLFQIDPKHQLAVEPLAREIVAAKAMERVSVGSFSDQRVRRVRQLVLQQTGTTICTVMGPWALGCLLLRSKVAPRLAWRSSVPSVMPPMKCVTPRFIRAAHAGKVEVIPWTVNERADMIRLLDMGVDGLITDFPSRLKEVLESRGQWQTW